MNKSILVTLLGLALPAAAQTEKLEYVSLLQGTDSEVALSHGNTLPLVGAPWGMTDWSIENAEGPWFFQPNGKIDGIRATHQPSPWISDYGEFVLMPQAGALRADTAGRMTEYDTATSILRPDYQKLELTRDQITAELTASERCGVFRLTFHQGDTGRLLVNARGDSEIKIEGRTIRGISRANSGGVAGDFGLRFVIELDRDVTKSELPGTKKDAAAYVEFKTAPGDPVEARVGCSLISWEQAERNLRAETEGGFAAARARVQALWETNLSRIEIPAGEPEALKTFYSCLYRAQMFPHRLYELDAAGKAIHYSPYDGKIHDGVLYGDIGIWDAFRTTFPLITILYPAQLNEILQGFVNASSEGGTLPEWPSPGYRDCMIGQHCAAIFADAVVKGHAGFDVAKAYESLRRSAFQPPAGGELVRRGLADYLERGYIPDGASTYAVSASLDYAYDDWCVAQMAKRQNRMEDFKVLTERAQNYRRSWDSGVGFMRAKTKAGSWVEPFDAYAWGGPYAEGGPWQSSWFAPHDTAGLAGLAGGREKLTEKLDQMLGLPPVFHVGGYGQVIHEMSEMGNAKFGQYAHNNQPVFDVLFLYAALGQPWKTEYWTRRVCAELYNSGPRGFQGDEDNGSMASWYVLSAIGLYPLCPGTPEYVFTSSVFADITVRLPEGKTFKISAAAVSEKNVYVQKRQLNGKEESRTFMTHEELMGGGHLQVEMGAFANMAPVKEGDLPYSASR